MSDKAVDEGPSEGPSEGVGSTNCGTLGGWFLAQCVASTLDTGPFAYNCCLGG